MTQPQASDGRFQRFCVVGLGNHARTKLVPALSANGQDIVGFVSRQNGVGLPDAPIFETIGEALAQLPSDTVFVIATPPVVHFEQILAVIRGGRDTIVEKPAFIAAEDAVTALAETKERGSVLVEAFMHRHTELYRRALAYWHDAHDVIEAVEADFVIPAIPPGTFRHNANIGNSCLYDIGCYPLALFADLGLPLGNVGIAAVEHPADPGRESIHLSGTVRGIKLDARVGVGPAYSNRVAFRRCDGELVNFAPFFYGRAGDRVITVERGGEARQETVREDNAFERMFAVARTTWRADQDERGKRIIDISANLERLGRAFAERRSKTFVH